MIPVNRRSLTISLILLLIIASGITIDARGGGFGQMTAALMAWTAYGCLVLRARAGLERRELLFCLVIATIGEIFLGFTWGLYQYRRHNLPLFIPPGHGVVYAAGRRLSRQALEWWPKALALGLLPMAVAGVWFGYDTQAPLWFGVFIICLLIAPDRRFTATMFVFALLIETEGTTLGGWRYLSPDPWFGMRTVTKPPLWAGTFYCALDVLVAFAAAATGTKAAKITTSSTT